MPSKLKGALNKTLNYLSRTLGPRVRGSWLAAKGELGLSAFLLTEIFLAVWLLTNLGGLTSTLLATLNSREISEKKISQIQLNTKQVRNSPEAAQSLLESLPGRRDNYSLLEALNASAGANQVSLLSINFLPIKSSGLAGLSEQPVEIALAGNFENVFAFITELEKSERPVSAESLEITGNNKVLGSGMVGVNVVLKSYLAEVSQ